MTWDKRTGSIHYINTTDISSPPTINDLVDLTKLGFEFRVEITKIENGSFEGVVRTIGPTPAIEAIKDTGVRREGCVSFSENNIFALHRVAGA